MKKWLQKRLKNEKGLTLVELLAVIVILGIIAAIAVPAIGGVISNSKVGAMKADVLNAISAAELYALDSKNTTITLADLTTASESYLSDKGSLTEFVYTVSSKTATFTAENDSISIVSTGSNKKEVTDLPNNTKNGVKVGNITVTRQ